MGLSMGRASDKTLRWMIRYLHNHSHRHEFEWKREECFMIRKPDPPVLIAVTKEPAGRIKTTSVQILDYNINRYVRLYQLHVYAMLKPY